MRRTGAAMVAAFALIGAGGCVRTVTTVATAPVKAVGKVVDWSTTSPSERDRNYVRAMRKRDARCRKHPERAECAQQSGYPPSQPQ